MTATRDTRFEYVLDSAAMTRFQIGVVLLCALVAMLDGFDTQSIAFAAPDIATEWALPASAFGLVFSIGVFGGLIGAVAAGSISDRIGRRPVLLCAVALFALATLATPLTMSLPGLVGLRLVAGFGLGAALPGMVSITSEYTPARLRTMAVALMFAGFPLGGVVSGLAAAALVPAFGWTSLFYVGGIALLLLPLLWWLLPESAQFLALRGDNIALNRITARLDFSGAGPLGSSDAVATDDHGIPPAAARTLVARLFGEGRAPGTLLLWTALFLSLLATYLLVNWIPIIARESGTTADTATFGPRRAQPRRSRRRIRDRPAR
jgi:AAHS family 4-hydroxybenzoate transporter-like MFS transporter